MLCLLVARLWQGILKMKDPSKESFEKKKKLIYAVRYSGYAFLIIALILILITESE